MTLFTMLFWSVAPQQSLIHQGSLSTWEAIFGDNFLVMPLIIYLEGGGIGEQDVMEAWC